MFLKCVKKIQVSLKSDKNNGTLQKDQYTFFIISRSLLLRMRNVSYKFVEKIKTLILCSKIVFRKSCRYEITWKNFVQRSMPQMTIWRMRVACWIPKAANAILIAFPLQQWLHERASILRYTYIACIVLSFFLSLFL